MCKNKEPPCLTLVSHNGRADCWSLEEQTKLLWNVNRLCLVGEINSHQNEKKLEERLMS